MIELTPTRIAVVAAVLATVVAAGTGIAVADPRLDSAVNTTCTYPQVMAALDAQNPTAGGSPVLQDMLRQFLGAPTPQRQQMAEAIAGYPANQPYLGLLQTVFDTCNNF